MGHMNREYGGNDGETLGIKDDQRSQELMAELRSGYEAMGTINLQFAESIQEQELNQLEQYESILAMGRD